MTYGQAEVACPQCGSAAAVHSIAEWAAMAQGPMGGQWQPGPQPGYPASPGPGPQTGFPDPSQYQQSGFPDPSQYQQSGFPDPSQYQQPGSAAPSQDPSAGSSAEPPPASQAQPPPASQAQPPPAQQPGYPAPGPWPPGQQGGYPGEPWQSQPPPRRSSGWGDTGSDVSLGDSIGEAVVDAAMGFLGRTIGRRVRRTLEERVVPAMAVRQQEMTRQRMAIAERHPDLRFCLNDKVVFLAGGTRVLPLTSAMQVTTVEQSDAIGVEQRDAAQPRLPDPPGQGPARIRRDLVPVLQPCRVHHETHLGVERRQVGVAPDGDASLGGQARQRGGRRGHPTGHVVQRPPAPPGHGPHRRQAELQRCDTAPGRAEVARAGGLQLGRAGRVIGHHAVDDPGFQPAPQCLPVDRVPDRRAGLELGRAVGYLLGREEQVVRAGLGGQPDARRLGAGDHRHALGSGQVHDVRPGAGCGRGRDDLLDGAPFGDRRP
jgi:hypothetical protein